MMTWVPSRNLKKCRRFKKLHRKRPELQQKKNRQQSEEGDLQRRKRRKEKMTQRLTRSKSCCQLKRSLVQLKEDDHEKKTSKISKLKKKLKLRL